MVLEDQLQVMMSRFGEKVSEIRSCLLGNAERRVLLGGLGGESGNEKPGCLFSPVTSLPTVWFCIFMMASHLMYSGPASLGLLRLVLNFGLRKHSHSL